jgi:serine/threonine-protein kinase/endoribonuclease IRE1
MNTPLLVLSHLLIALLSVLLVTSSPSPAPDPYPAVISLPARPSASTIRPAPEVEHDLLPFVLVSTIDGALHAVDRDVGEIRWSLQEGVDPLIGGGAAGSGSEEDYIVEPLSGSLYVFEEGEEDAPKVRKLPLSVDKL